MEGKPVSNSRVHLAELMLPEHANPAGNVHGGTIMKLIDNAAFIAAQRHTRRNCVTASVDKIDFISPVFIGNLITARAQVNFTSKRSMEVGVRIEKEEMHSGEQTHVGTAYLTFVSLDEQNRPLEVPAILPETEEEKRRFDEASKRRSQRLKSRCYE